MKHHEIVALTAKFSPTLPLDEDKEIETEYVEATITTNIDPTPVKYLLRLNAIRGIQFNDNSHHHICLAYDEMGRLFILPI